MLAGQRSSVYTVNNTAGPSSFARMYGPVFFCGFKMINPYVKPHLSVHAQIELLRSRGMMITDDAQASQYLNRIGYYRLSGYWYPFRQSKLIVSEGKPSAEILEEFHAGTEFKHAVDLYVFDKKLRLIILDAIERIEIALRVDIAHLLGSYSPWAHRDSKFLHGKFGLRDVTGMTAHQKWIAKLEEREKRSKEDFIRHYRKKYSTPLPIWMSVEVWDFGLMSNFLENIQINDQSMIATKYGIPRPELLLSWVKSINHIRNICAHHSRLWNSSPVDQPKQTKSGEIPDLDHLLSNPLSQVRIYAVIAIIQFILRTINPTSSWKNRLKDHMQHKFPSVPVVNVRQSGFPDNWHTLRLWQ